VLERAGCRVIKLKHIGTGRTKLSKGLLKGARRDGARLLAEIKKIDPQGNLPVVGIEPSEVATFTDEFLSLFPDDAYSHTLSKRAYSIEEFLLRAGSDDIPRYRRMGAVSEPVEILLHGHCYQKAQKPMDDGLPFGVGATTALFEALGCEVALIESGCCGMAGAFGYESKHYELSKQVAELSLLPAVRAKHPEQVLVAPGASCRTQIADLAGEQALHPVTLLWQLIAS
jgi:Fe-S oxidoreductase